MTINIVYTPLYIALRAILSKQQNELIKSIIVVVPKLRVCSRLIRGGESSALDPQASKSRAYKLARRWIRYLRDSAGQNVETKGFGMNTSLRSLGTIVPKSATRRQKKTTGRKCH